jgi:hypothetical protein
MLGSTAKEDQCRVCGGDGTTCTSVQGIAEQNDFQTGTDRDNQFYVVFISTRSVIQMTLI